MKIPPSGKRGLALIMVGIVCFAVIAGFMATRNFEPVNMPVSFSPGHFSTGDFRINTEGMYSVDIFGGDSTCAYGASENFKAKWMLFKEGQIVSQGTTRNWWFWGSFNAADGMYKLDVDIISSPSCLNSGSSRLYVSSYGAYTRYADARNAIGFISFLLVAVGLVLLIRSYIVIKVGRRVPPERVIADGEIQYPRPDPRSRFPLNRRFSGLPSYGITATLVIVSIFLTYWIFYSWFNNPRSKGHYVRITKPTPNAPTADIAQDPIIVRVQRSTERSSTQERSELYLNSQRVAWEDLSKKMRAELSRRADRVVYIDGDENLPYQDIAQIIDITREAWPDVPVVLLTPDMDDKVQKLFVTVYKEVPELYRSSFHSGLKWMIYSRKSEKREHNGLLEYEPSTVKYIAPDTWAVEGCALFSPSPIKNSGVVATVSAKSATWGWQFSEFEIAHDEKNSAYPCNISR